jgi:hypothetical protein
MSVGLRRDERTAVIDEPRGDEPLNEELAELVAELEKDANVRLSLDDVPEIPQLKTAERLPEDEVTRKPSVPASRYQGGNNEVIPVVVYRDKDDVRTILNLTWVVMIVAVLLVASGVGNLFQFYRRPDRIVVDGSSGRVLSINDRNYGKEDGVEFGPDRLTTKDKLYITREFVRALYQIDPATRPKDIERVLTMMVPDSAVKFAKWMREKGVLDQQKSESWQAVWTPMDVSVDGNDPYTINVIGKQDITRLVNGASVKDAKQLRLTIKLVADNKGRADRNLRSGFLISYIDYKELSQPSDASDSQSAPVLELSPAQTSSSVTPVTALQDH